MGLGLLDSVFAGTGGIANQLINLFGTSIVISYTTRTSYNPATQQAAVEAPTSYTIDASPPTPYTTREIDGTKIKTGDMRLLIPVIQAPEKPPVGAQVTYDGQEWRIEYVEDIKSGNQGAAYRLQIRRT